MRDSDSGIADRKRFFAIGMQVVRKNPSHRGDSAENCGLVKRRGDSERLLVVESDGIPATVVV
jgi:hypothetical protein